MFVNFSEPLNVCCDAPQLVTMQSQLNLVAAFLKRCPSCITNLLQHICQLTCSPHQSKFVNVTEIKKNSNGKYMFIYIISSYVQYRKTKHLNCYLFLDNKFSRKIKLCSGA